MSRIRPERVTADIDGDFVVFLIGIRVNAWWKLHKWVPVFRAMPRMLRELSAQEESGLLGSRYYSDHPVIPIEKTVAALNTDMISRNDPEHIEAGITDYVYLIGGDIISSQLDSLVVDANKSSVNMQLDRKYNALDDPNQFYRRSDHWNFGRLSVPFVFFFTGVHEDYHQPGDEVYDVDFEKFPRVVQLIYNSAVNIANYDGRPEVDNQEFIEITGESPR